MHTIRHGTLLSVTIPDIMRFLSVHFYFFKGCHTRSTSHFQMDKFQTFHQASLQTPVRYEQLFHRVPRFGLVNEGLRQEARARLRPKLIRGGQMWTFTFRACRQTQKSTTTFNQSRSRICGFLWIVWAKPMNNREIRQNTQNTTTQSKQSERSSLSANLNERNLWTEFVN